MRRRNIKDAAEKISNCKYVITNIGDQHKKLTSLFENENPLHIEIGMGKGQFLVQMALKHPDINFIGIEKYPSILVPATKKISDLQITNIRFLCYDANNILDLFNDNEIQRIYLNFSDPWTKSGHQKRRLSHSTFLEKYKKILTNNGSIWLKSDNRNYFEFSITEIANFGFRLKNVCLDLHKSDFEDNVLTEYEEKFMNNGPIYRLEAYK